MMENVLKWVLLALGILVSAFGGYVAGYLKQKGQNLATHEDIDKLVDQVRAVTTTTKEIEAKISDEYWDRQKRWELKRDLLVEMIKKTAVLEEALSKLHAVYLTNKRSNDPDNPARSEATLRAATGYNHAAAEYEQASLVVDLVCGTEVKQVLLFYHKLVRDLGQAIMDGRPEAFMESSKEIFIKRTSILNALRDEIGSGPLVPTLK